MNVHAVFDQQFSCSLRLLDGSASESIFGPAESLTGAHEATAAILLSWVAEVAEANTTPPLPHTWQQCGDCCCWAR